MGEIMNGPYERGTFDDIPKPSDWDWEKKRMQRGAVYRIVVPFVDADGDEHGVGEEWVFISTMFSRFDDELTICVRRDGHEWKIPLFWTPDAHGNLIENFNNYVVEVDG